MNPLLRLGLNYLRSRESMPIVVITTLLSVEFLLRRPSIINEAYVWLIMGPCILLSFLWGLFSSSLNSHLHALSLVSPVGKRTTSSAVIQLSGLFSLIAALSFTILAFRWKTAPLLWFPVCLFNFWLAQLSITCWFNILHKAQPAFKYPGYLAAMVSMAYIVYSERTTPGNYLMMLFLVVTAICLLLVTDRKVHEPEHPPSTHPIKKSGEMNRAYGLERFNITQPGIPATWPIGLSYFRMIIEILYRDFQFFAAYLFLICTTTALSFFVANLNLLIGGLLLSIVVAIEFIKNVEFVMYLPGARRRLFNLLFLSYIILWLFSCGLSLLINAFFVSLMKKFDYLTISWLCSLTFLSIPTALVFIISSRFYSAVLIIGTLCMLGFLRPLKIPMSSVYSYLLDHPWLIALMALAIPILWYRSYRAFRRYAG